ncbi:CpaF family protein [Candidatus Woesearchaeota archaeon]|nr:CpaF family protein [Candidatus Woesearchaeota archaeon]
MVSPKEKKVEKTKESEAKVIDSYEFLSDKMPISIRIFSRRGDFVPTYETSIASISESTEFILEKIRQELITKVNIGMLDIVSSKRSEEIDQRFIDAIDTLVKKYFPDVDTKTSGFLISYLIQRSLGMGNLEILMDDENLEEIAVNSAEDPVWVFHKKYGWLKTNIKIQNEETIKHYATILGRRIGRQISVLEPLLDAHIGEGDRANATLMPISSKGNTITLRKYSRDPFTITHFLRGKTISINAASLIWLAMQFELSAIIAGGTASGKTATLNVLASFIPPNQRVISIEDTRELRLPKFLHWVPMLTRQPNAEGKGAVAMADLLVNSLRMRPDRILVGEVRRQREAETLFEAIHTGHSCYATFHANNAKETVERFLNPPINVPSMVLPAMSLIITQFRNRRTGTRRTFQVAEILPDSTPNVLMQYDPKKDVLVDKNKSTSLMDSLEMYTGYTLKEITESLREREAILKYLVDLNIDHIDDVGKVIAEYYTDKGNLFAHVRKKQKLE